MSLNIARMLTGEPNRLQHVTRFSGDRVLFPQNVATHSWQVAFYSLLIGRWVEAHARQQVGRPGLGVLLQRAILHDLEEAHTGDIRRPFKHGSPKTRDALEEAAAPAFDKVLGGVVTEPNALASLRRHWQLAKDKSLEGRILELADFLSALSAIHQEWESGNRKVVEDTGHSLIPHIEKFYTKEYEFLRPLVDQAEAVLQEIYGKLEINIARGRHDGAEPDSRPPAARSPEPRDYLAGAHTGALSDAASGSPPRKSGGADARWPEGG